MNIPSAKSYQHQNYLHSLLLLIAMLGLLALIGFSVAGPAGVLGAFAIFLLIIITGPRVSSRFILSLYRARLIHPEQAPELYNGFYKLVDKAQIKYPPALYYLPSQVLNTFTVGLKKDTCIVISDGLLRCLDNRELTAVLAHEISHIRNHDLWVMFIADVLSRLTSLLALSGYLLILLYLPMLILYEQLVPWLLLIILVLAPNISALLQLALSRTREYSADLVAAQLTGDPLGLASALNKLEYYQHSWIERILLPGHKVPDPSLLRSHPTTQSRIRRLNDIAQEFPQHSGIFNTDDTDTWLDTAPKKNPRRRISGLWY
ncbi:MAG: M48 family metalloprotease [gamma proteobacterium symbiont of Lucinoma myriamae]|nr:M48 family metalloprotease [gamma proteobacterium symbiont of Lucinoma myriamae]MCU7819561.1 M48 family metalloprotease [gamma proteobacterium symbiont of Lucinoma myriamae]MCU7833297.1 M48 family metalloprotease [gamma proteobacterium symbiont of Lucinoma myriamae]